MASAVCVWSEHKVNIDRSKETGRFYCEFTSIRITMREKRKVQKKVTATVECRFQFYAYFLIKDYERVLPDYSRPIELVT